MKRYAYIESIFNQVIFCQTKGEVNYLRKFFPNLMHVEHKEDEQDTIAALQKKYNIKLKWQEITDGRGSKWMGYIKEDLPCGKKDVKPLTSPRRTSPKS